MNCFTDPELAGHRLFAAARVSRFGGHGFPQQPGTGRTAALRLAAQDATDGGARGWARALTAVAGALIASASAVALCGYLGREVVRDPGGVIAGPPGVLSPQPSPAPPGPPRTHPVAAALPLGLPEVPAPAIAMGEPPKDFLWAPDPVRLDIRPARLTLPAGGTGAITLACPSETVRWRASGGGPVRLSPAEGTLRPDAAQVVGVHVPANGPGSAVITFWPGGEQVTIAWEAPSPPPSSPPPSSPPSSPPPTPTPTPTPTPDPTTPVPTPPPPSRPTPVEPAPPTPAPTSAPAPSDPPTAGPDGR
jgi:hypothetical protein